MTHMLSLEEQMTRMKRKPSDLPGDQPPPKLLKQNTSTNIDTAFEKDSDIDNIPPPVLEKADSYLDRPVTVPFRRQSNDNGSNSSTPTPPPLLPQFPTLTPTKPATRSEKYFGFDVPSDDEDDDVDDTITKIADSIYVGDSNDSFENVPQKEGEIRTTTACIGTNTMYDSDGSSDKTPMALNRAETLILSENNGSNGENKKVKLTKKGIVKKVMTPKKSTHSKKDSEIKKEKSIVLDSLESLRTIQKMPSGTAIEKIMKFGAEEIILPSDKSLAVYEFDDESKNSSSLLQRPSLQVVSDTLKSIECDTSPDTNSSTLPKLDCVSSEELTASEISDSETNSAAPTLQKITSPTKSPKKFIHGGIREIVFSFDTTGSMYSYMEETKDKMREIVERLKIDIPGVRLAFIAHGDYYDLKNDRYLIKSLDFGATIDEICNFFEYLPITHGGDADECYELVLRKVRESLSWTTGSQRCLVMIGDSDPHEPGYQFEEYTNDIDWKEETKKLSEMGVRIYGMQVGYRSDFYRQISQMTGGAHLRIENDSLTPDMLMSVCLREGNLKLLKTYEAEVMKRPEYKGGLDLELARLFSSLKNVADNIAMKFKKNLIEGVGEKENGKKAVKRNNDSESPGSKIAKMARKALDTDGNKIKPKLSPEKSEKLKKISSSDKIAKSLVKKAIKGNKDKKKTAVTKDKKITPVKRVKKSVEVKDKKKIPVKPMKKTLLKKDVNKKPLKKVTGVKKTKLPAGSKTKKKSDPKKKQTAAKLKAKSVIKAILKAKTKKPVSKSPKKTPAKSKLNTSLKEKKSVSKAALKNKSATKLPKTKAENKKKQVSNVKGKGAPVKKIVKPKVKTVDTKSKTVKKLPEKKKDVPKKKEEKKTEKSKVTTKQEGKVKTTPEKVSPKKTVVKKSMSKPIKVKKPKDLQPREIASIAKFVTGPLSCLSWEQWNPLIAHEKPKTGNWSKGKGGCPGFCNSDMYKEKSPVPVIYEFAVSPPDSSKKYPVYFYAQGDNIWDFCKDKYVREELERVIKSKGSISARRGTVNKDDDALFLKTVENVKNMFDYAWNSNSSKETARKADLVKEGFIVAKV